MEISNISGKPITHEGPLYALYLASNNKTAINITNSIFGRYEKLKATGNQ